MTQNQTFTIIITIIILVLAGWWFWQANRTADEPVQTAVLTEQAALDILDLYECLPEGVEAEYESCSVDVTEINEDQYEATVVYEGWADDSVHSTRYHAPIWLEEGEWVLGEVSEDYICREGRGQQEFAPELCL